MPGIELEFLEFVQTKDAITDLVGDRIYPGVLESSMTTYPSLTYAVLMDTSLMDMDGVNGLAHAKIRYRIYSLLYTDIVSVTSELDDAFNGYQGLMVTSWADLITMGGITDLKGVRVSAGSPDIRRSRNVVFDIWYKRGSPALV